MCKLINHELFSNSSTGPIQFEIPGMALAILDGQTISDAKFSVFYDEQFDLRIRMQSEGDLSPKTVFEDRKLALSFKQEGLGEFPCIATKITLGSNAGITTELLPFQQPVVLDKKISVPALTGVISNGPNFLIPTYSNPERTEQRPVIVTFGEWSISIYQFPHTRGSFENRPSLSGRKIVTHWFKIVRVDGLAFLGNNAVPPLVDFLDFLSFMRGARVGVFHVTDAADSNSQTYARIGSNRHGSFGGPNNWFDYTLTSTSNDIFQILCRAFKEPEKRLTVRRAIEYYCLGNSMQPNSTESALIMTYAALETLAFSIIGKRAFKKAKNSKGMQRAIRDAANALSVTTDPVNGLKALKSRMSIEGWGDGYEAITKFRNGVTHSQSIKYTGRELVEAWTAAQWLVEVLLLVWLGYDGEFSDRRTKKWVGERVKISSFLTP